MNNNLLKKLAAGATTVAMLASLGVTAFAHTYKYNVDGGLTIDSVSATYAENGTVRNYTITVTYSGVTTDDQVTVLGYIFGAPTNTDTDLAATNITDKTIHAVNQEEGSGTTIIKLSSEGEKAVTGEETLIIKMGTDNDRYTAAQAVSIDLTSAKEEGSTSDPVPVKWAATGAELVGTVAEQEATATAESIIAVLNAMDVKVTGANSGEEATTKATWELKSGSTVVAGSTATFVGTVTAGADDEWTGTATAEATVTIKAAAENPPVGGLLGDANGDGAVNGLDALTIQLKVLGKGTINSEDLADYNKDGSVNGLDALAIQLKVLGKA